MAAGSRAGRRPHRHRARDKGRPARARVEVDGQRVVRQASGLSRPAQAPGVVSTMSDPEGRPHRSRLSGRRVGGARLPGGRLDFNTSGALLVTNDGDFSGGPHAPPAAVPKTYVVKVQGLMEDRDLDRWRRGVDLEDGKTLPAKVKLLRHEGDKTWLELTITEGRNQQVRRMGDATGFRVMRLARMSFAGVGTEGLRAGKMALPHGRRARDVEEGLRRAQARRVAAQAGGLPRSVRRRAATGPGAAPKRSHARPEGLDSRRAPLRPGPSRPSSTSRHGAVEDPGRPDRDGAVGVVEVPTDESRSVQASAVWAVQVGGFASGAFASGAFEVVETGARQPRVGPALRRGSRPSRLRSARRLGWRSPAQRRPERAGRDGDDPPRGDVGGRGGRTRTTGSGGGVGAGAGSYRIKGRHG